MCNSQGPEASNVSFNKNSHKIACNSEFIVFYTKYTKSFIHELISIVSSVAAPTDGAHISGIGNVK